MGKVTALVGAQWGSEGKGVIAAGLARSMPWTAAVRVGGPNAGHSFYEDGRLYKMRSIPCAWIQAETAMLIGAGGVVNPTTLLGELESVRGDVVVQIDRRVAVINEEMEEAEHGIKESIGSTGEGVGQARIARIRRDGKAVLAGDYPWDRYTDRVRVREDISAVIGRALLDGHVMMEGTQGSGLSLFHGDYPYVTSSDTNVAGMLSEAGIAPEYLGHVHLVARAFPIRVGGNSGPMGHELDWADLPVDVPERTTVTNKIRRIATWSDDVFDTAVRLNRPCGVWLTFGDYLDPSIRGTTDWRVILRSEAIAPLFDRIEHDWRVPILGVGTGGPGFQVAGGQTCKHGDRWPILGDLGLPAVAHA